MKRRDLFKLTAALAAVPAAAVAAPADAPPATWTPSTLNGHQNETVIALTDLIIPETDTPGAKAANVNRYIDLFLKQVPSEQSQAMISGLGWLDQYSNSKYGRGFIGCTKPQQIAMLETVDANKEPGLQPGHEFFQMMKGMTSQFYYNTAIGYRELNKGGRVPSTFGCQHGGHA